MHEFTPILKKIDEVLQNLPSPTPTITIMGDLNFHSSVISWQMVEGVLHPKVAEYRVREGQRGVGVQVRHQAAQFCTLATKYNLTQQVGVATREKQILDLVWSSNPDLISNIQVDTFLDMTDHSVVTATTSYRVNKAVDKEKTFLLDS